MKHWGKALFGLLVTVLLLWWALADVAFSEVWDNMRRGNLWLLFASVSVATFGFFIRALRWKVLLAHVKADTALRSRFAGVSIGSLYQYFPNKQAIVDALRERHDEFYEREVQEGIERSIPLDFRAGLERMLTHMVDLHRRDSKLHSEMRDDMRLGVCHFATPPKVGEPRRRNPWRLYAARGRHRPSLPPSP